MAVLEFKKPVIPRSMLVSQIKIDNLITAMCGYSGLSKAQLLMNLDLAIYRFKLECEKQGMITAKKAKKKKA